MFHFDWFCSLKGKNVILKKQSDQLHLQYDLWSVHTCMNFKTLNKLLQAVVPLLTSSQQTHMELSRK